MQLTDFARRLPDDVWDLFEPLLPARVWCGNGRPPASDRDCLHAVFYVLISGIAWRMLPKGFPSYRTAQRRLKLWLRRDAFRQAWGLLAEKYERLQGVNWDQILLDGSKKPAKKGASRRGLLRSIAPSAAPPCT
jgi:transposase